MLIASMLPSQAVSASPDRIPIALGTTAVGTSDVLRVASQCTVIIIHGGVRCNLQLLEQVLHVGDLDLHFRFLYPRRSYETYL